MSSNYLHKISKNDLLEFIGLCKELDIEIDSQKFQNIAINTMKYLNGDKTKRDELRYMQDIENRWYESLSMGSPDFSVYDDVYYLADAWVCWKKYSREYIKSIESKMSLAERASNGEWSNFKSMKDYIGEISCVADLGCGIGYSTAAIKELFNCKVIATNLEGTKQYKICEYVSKKSGFKLVSNLTDIGKCDLVFASEYFEHFERPIEHLEEVLKLLRPKFILFANTFNAKSIGHFIEYKHKETLFGKNSYDGKQMSRLFTKHLKSSGYRKVQTNCFNDRPNLYEYCK